MPTVTSVLGDLKQKANEKTRATYVRHGMPADRVIGVSVADIKLIAKGIKGQQVLARDLYKTGMMEAMYLAGMVADGSKIAKQELDAWADSAAGLAIISEYPV